MFGAYDNVNAPVAQTIDTDFVLFNDHQADCNGWQSKPAFKASNTPRMNNRWYKTIYEPEGYDYSIYVDPSVEILSPHFAERIIASLDYEGMPAFYAMAMYEHPGKRDWYHHGLWTARSPRYADLGDIPMWQVESYWRDGLKAATVYSGAFIVRKLPYTARVRELGVRWWAEMQKWGHMDEISLSYVLWQMGGGVRSIEQSEGNAWQNTLFKHHLHKKAPTLAGA